MNRKMHNRRVKRSKSVFGAWLSGLKKKNKGQEDYLLELNEMIIDKNRLGSCEYCGIIFEKQDNVCPSCGKKIS